MFQFPEYSGAKCYMMPIIQGNPDSLPDPFKGYSSFVSSNVLEVIRLVGVGVTGREDYFTINPTIH